MEKAKKNPKLIYAYLKEQNKCKEAIRSLINSNGETIVDKGKIVNCLNDCFVKVFSSCDDEASFPTLAQSQAKCFITEKELFSSNNVENELKKLDTTKTMGADGIHPIILNKCANSCSKILSAIFVKSYETGIVPLKWKEADLTPLPKSGTKTNPSNYRPISLTSVPCKVMERIIKSKMMEHLITNNLIVPQQHGFVKQKSCLTNLIETLDFLTESLNRGFYAILIYLDFAKAFDKVSHKALIYKLQCYGYNEKLIRWLIGFLTKRRQRVKIEDAYSEWREVLSGVPQGSVLGPLLFVIFINDMPKLVTNIVKLFADDSKLLAQIKNKNIDYKTIQSDLDSLVTWANEWKMCFNSGKCKWMRIGRGKLIKHVEEIDGKTVSKRKIIHDNEPITFYMIDSSTGNQHKLEETTVERDLGVLISNDLKSFAQSKKAAAKANSVLGQLKRSIIKFDKFTLKTLYTSIVRPHLEYASSAWSPYRSKDIKILETVQRRATKLVPELRNLPYEKRLTELGLTTLKERRERGDAIQYFKIINNINIVDWYHPNNQKPSSNINGPSNNIRNNKVNSNQIYRQFTKSCDQREYFFSNRVVPIWNKLPNSVTNAKNVNNFKNEYDKFKRRQTKN